MSEELKAFKRLTYFSSLYELEVWKDDFDTIEKGLKALDIIREIGFHEAEYITCVNYETYCETRDFPISKEEFNLLKEVFDYD